MTVAHETLPERIVQLLKHLGPSPWPRPEQR